MVNVHVFLGILESSMSLNVRSVTHIAWNVMDQPKMNVLFALQLFITEKFNYLLINVYVSKAIEMLEYQYVRDVITLV